MIPAAVVMGGLTVLNVLTTADAWMGRRDSWLIRRLTSRPTRIPTWWPFGATLWHEYPRYQPTMGMFGGLFVVLILGLAIGGREATIAVLAFFVGYVICVALVLSVAFRGRPRVVIPPMFRADSAPPG